METLSFILHNLPAIGERTLEHISIVGVAVGIAILTGVPIGIAITQSQRIADTVLYLGSIVMTIPSIALFGVLIPILSKIGQGIGWLPAVIAAMLYAQLPIIRNTYTAIRNVDPALRSGRDRHGDVGRRSAWCGSRSRSRCRSSSPASASRSCINIGVTAIAALYRRRRPGHVHQPRHLADGHPAAHHRCAVAGPARDRRRLRAAAAAAAADAEGPRGPNRVTRRHDPPRSA